MSPQAITQDGHTFDRMGSGAPGVSPPKAPNRRNTYVEVLNVATGHRTQPVHHGGESEEPPVLVAFGGIDPNAYGAGLVLLADWHSFEWARRSRKAVKS